jgi:hypothetical protein
MGPAAGCSSRDVRTGRKTRESDAAEGRASPTLICVHARPFAARVVSEVRARPIAHLKYPRLSTSVIQPWSYSIWYFRAMAAFAVLVHHSRVSKSAHRKRQPNDQETMSILSRYFRFQGPSVSSLRPRICAPDETGVSGGVPEDRGLRLPVCRTDRDDGQGILMPDCPRPALRSASASLLFSVWQPSKPSCAQLAPPAARQSCASSWEQPRRRPVTHFSAAFPRALPIPAGFR